MPEHSLIVQTIMHHQHILPHAKTQWLQLDMEQIVQIIFSNNII